MSAARIGLPSRVIGVAFAFVLLGSACGRADVPALAPLVQPDPTTSEAPTAPTADATVPPVSNPAATERATTPSLLPDLTPRMRVVVERRLTHATASYTQGLLFDDGRLYESRGERGESAITEIDPETGALLRGAQLDPTLWAEGIALFDGKLFQLTYTAGVAYVFDVETFQVLDQFPYEGEGWGLCATDDGLYMSDGSSTLERRDPATFEVLSSVTIHLGDDAISKANELECIGDHVWANLHGFDAIIVIDPTTGAIVSVIDASGLLNEADVSQVMSTTQGTPLLNGMAYNAATGTLLLTGKDWPAMFEVSLEPCDDCTVELPLAAPAG